MEAIATIKIPASPKYTEDRVFKKTRQRVYAEFPEGLTDDVIYGVFIQINFNNPTKRQNINQSIN